MKRNCSALLFLLLPVLLFGAGNQGKTTWYSASDVVVKGVHPHNEASFTEGFFFNGDVLCESAGNYKESGYYEDNLKKFGLLRDVFGEGSVMLGGKLFLLTWKNRLAYIYNASTLELLNIVSYPREGWGLTTDGKQLIASDGSSTLYFMDTGFSVKKKITVTLDGDKLNLLNELEYVDGLIFANVFTYDYVAVIDAGTGKVKAMLDFTDLFPYSERNDKADVMNGLAWNPKTETMWVTGKYWDRTFELDISSIMDAVKTK